MTNFNVWMHKYGKREGKGLKRSWLFRLAVVLVLAWLFLLSPAKVPINRAFFILNNGDRTFTANYWLGFAPWSAAAALLCKVFQTALLVLPEKSTVGAMVDLFGAGGGLALGWAGAALGQLLLYGLARFLLGAGVDALARRVRRLEGAVLWVRKASPWLALAGAVCPLAPAGAFALLWGAAGCPLRGFLAGAVPGALLALLPYAAPGLPLRPVLAALCVLAVLFPAVRALRGRA